MQGPPIFEMSPEKCPYFWKGRRAVPTGIALGSKIEDTFLMKCGGHIFDEFWSTFGPSTVPQSMKLQPHHSTNRTPNRPGARRQERGVPKTHNRSGARSSTLPPKLFLGGVFLYFSAPLRGLCPGIPPQRQGGI